MHNYQTILVAVDFSAHSEQALSRAKQLADIYSADLQVLHVTEIPTYPVLEDIAITGLPGIWSDDVADKVQKAALTRLVKMAEKEAISASACQVIVGTPKQDIVKQAELKKVDLIVVGRRGASIIQRLIGSTADTILHNAQCDVLAVNLGDA
jgi:universal stress protein A